MDKINKKFVVLIIEDDEVLLRALYLLFRKNDFTVASASDGDTGLKMAQRLNPDIIILDLLLPKMSGLDVLKYLKSNPLTRDIPVIILSNLGDESDVEQAKSLGAIDYFIKAETDLSDLVKKTSKVLSEKSLGNKKEKIKV
jgi:DNA-binding response OmpR family regulator